MGTLVLLSKSSLYLGRKTGELSLLGIVLSTLVVKLVSRLRERFNIREQLDREQKIEEPKG